MMGSLSLPYPVSANRYWRSFVPKGHRRAIVVLSDEAKSYKSQVGWIAKEHGLIAPLSGRVHLDCKLYPSLPKDAERRMRKHGDGWDDSVQCLDLDNALKVLIDSLKGIAYADDKQVFRLTAERMEPDGEARVVVAVSQIVLVSPQSEIRL